ncbi:hypothetical protein CBM2626_A160002 [Cupriavidus taiwanensis]|nr:hypothetical protein CBM2626_A160002 [Cupriavidus taiwanensis]
MRHGRGRQAPGRHHPGHARGLGHGRVREALPGPLLRRRHRRAACGDLRRRPGMRGPEAGGGDLLDLPAARLRPADPRRGAAEPAGGVRAGPRRPGRRRRCDPRRRLRYRLPALHPQHDGDDAVRRERVPPAADHGIPAGLPDCGTLSARLRPGRGDRRRPGPGAGGQGRGAPRGRCARRAPRRLAGIRLDGAAGAGRGRGARRHGGGHALRQAARRGAGQAPGRRPRLPGDGGRGQRDGRRRQRRAGGPGRGRHRQARFDAGAARPLRRPRRPGLSAAAMRPGCGRHRALGARAFRARPAPGHGRLARGLITCHPGGIRAAAPRVRPNSLTLRFLCSQLRVGTPVPGPVVSHSLRGMEGLRKCRDRKGLRLPAQPWRKP